MKIFRILFPYHKEQKLYRVIASMISNNELIEKSKENGLSFLTQKNKLVVLVNDKDRAFLIVTIFLEEELENTTQKLKIFCHKLING